MCVDDKLEENEWITSVQNGGVTNNTPCCFKGQRAKDRSDRDEGTGVDECDKGYDKIRNEYMRGKFKVGPTNRTIGVGEQTEVIWPRLTENQWVRWEAIGVHSGREDGPSSGGENDSKGFTRERMEPSRGTPWTVINGK